MDEPLSDIDALDNVGMLVSNHYLVDELQKALIAAPRDINRLVGAIIEVLERDPPAFIDRVDPDRGRRFNRYTAEQFRRFIEDPLPEGLESNEETVMKLVEDDPRALRLVVQWLDRGRGAPPGNQNAAKADRTGSETNVLNTNICSSPQDSPPTTKQRGGKDDVPYAIRRLSRERPDLLEKVEAGELSYHGAMIEAGFRKKKTPLENLRHWWQRATVEDRLTFLKEVQSGTD